MAGQEIVYGRLVEAALRTVVHDVLGRLERLELPEPHHFFITFRTGHPRVEMPDFLFARYPREMTIVLQHQYWDLETSEDGFGVTLSFNDKPERLIVPYEAIKVFADPGVDFGLQFTLEAEADETDDETRRSNPAETVQLPTKPRAVKDANEPEDDDDPTPPGAEIVTLDRFRKK